MLWTYSPPGNHLIKKGDVLFTLVYKELQPTNHFICMMQSKGTTGSDYCTTFIREAFDGSFNSYPVDDICINYQVVGGSILLSSEDLDNSNINVSLKNHSNGLLIQNDEAFSNNTNFQLININGKDCLMQKLQAATNQTIDITKYPAGMYIYRIVTENKSIKAGKVVLR